MLPFGVRPMRYALFLVAFLGCALVSLAQSPLEKAYWEAVELHRDGKVAEAHAKMKDLTKFMPKGGPHLAYFKELEMQAARVALDKKALAAPEEATKSVEELG